MELDLWGIAYFIVHKLLQHCRHQTIWTTWYQTIIRLLQDKWALLEAQTVKNLPARQETQVQPLGWEDSLEKGMAMHSSILAWRIPWTEEPGGPQSMASQSQTQLSD